MTWGGRAKGTVATDCGIDVFYRNKNAETMHKDSRIARLVRNCMLAASLSLTRSYISEAESHSSLSSTHNAVSL